MLNISKERKNDRNFNYNKVMFSPFSTGSKVNTLDAKQLINHEINSNAFLDRISDGMNSGQNARRQKLTLNMLRSK